MDIRTAADFMDRVRERRRESQRDARGRGLLPHVLRLFVERAGPVTRAALAQALPAMAPGQLDRELTRLDADDHLLLEGGDVILAYPFAAGPNAFGVTLADGQQRYACCAIDALGIAAMLGQRIDVRSRCHHSGAPLAFGVDPAGPEPAAAGLMAWVGERPVRVQHVCTTL